MRLHAGAILALFGALAVASCGGGGDEPALKTTPVVIGTGLEPEHAAGSPDGRLWLGAGDRVAALDPATRKLVGQPRRLPTRSRDSQLYDLAAGDLGVWAAAKDGSHVVLVPADENRPRSRERLFLKDFDPAVAVEETPLLKLAVGAGRVWAAAYDDTFVTIVDPASGRQTTANTAGIEDVAAGGGFGWVITEDDEPGASGGTLDRIDPRTGDAKTFELVDSPIAVAYGAGSVWVLLEDSVKRHDSSGREVATIDLEGTDASFGDIAVAGSTVWAVAGSGRRALRIDAGADELQGDAVPLPVDEPTDLVGLGDSAWLTADGRPPLRIGPG